MPNLFTFWRAFGQHVARYMDGTARTYCIEDKVLRGEPRRQVVRDASLLPPEEMRHGEPRYSKEWEIWGV
jgi:hypothetical protein